MGRSQLCSSTRGSSGSTPGTFCSRLRVSKGRGWKIQHLHNMSFLIVTKSCHGMREECRGKKKERKKRSRKESIWKTQEEKSVKYGGKQQGENGNGVGG